MAASADPPRPFASTYRLQMSASFGFRAAARAVRYLDELGITTAYVSPLLAGVPGGHGYDIVDPTRLDPSLGSARLIRDQPRWARAQYRCWFSWLATKSW